MDKQFFLNGVVASTTYHLKEVKKQLFFSLPIFFAVFFHPIALKATPAVYSPLLVIDCQKSKSVYGKSCFRHIAYLARAIDYSGLFEDVQSPAHVYFMTNLRQGYVSFEKKRPYNNSKWRDEILQRYQNIFSLSVDSTQRYVLFSVAQSGMLVDEPEYPQQLENLKKVLEAYLLGKPIRYFFANSPDFSHLNKAHFLQLVMHVEFSFDDNQKFFQNHAKINKLEKQMQTLQGVKATFSANDIFEELSVLSSKKGQQAFREFADEARSSYWQPAKEDVERKGKYFIALFQKGDEKIDEQKILQLLSDKEKNPFHTKLKIYSSRSLPFPPLASETLSYISIFEYLNKKRF